MPFIVYSEGEEKKVFILPEDKMTVFGREEYVDFQIFRDSEVSREHFAIEKDDNGKFIIIDLGSSNGTFLNGKKLESNAIVELNNDDEIRAGNQYFLYRTKPLFAPSESQEMECSYSEEDGFITSMHEIVKIEE